MLQWFQRLLPRQKAFFPLFEGHAAIIVRAARTLREMFAGEGEMSACSHKLIAEEHAADEIAREMLVGLRTTFITPFDLADIQRLISSMDDSVDQMQQTTKAVVLFEVTDFDP